MASKNSNLHGAKQAKNDEFYTQYHDIEKEMQAYLDYNPDVFRDKVVLLPCDDPEWSNFTKYFAQRFSELGLKKLISTSYVQPNHASSDAKGKIFTLSRDSNHDGVVDINDLEWKYLEGDGDFRSDEVTKLRDEADFIITNPPFSLFREFLGWIMDGGKTFAIIGSMNAITYKEVFPLIKDNKMWLGLYNGAKEYNLPNGDVQKMGNTLWFTNVEHGKRHQPLDIDTMDNNLLVNSEIKKNPNSYQKYQNYHAIEVPRTNGIPSDYDGVMGVPISFLDKYCPEQFEILGCSYSYGKPDGWNDDVNMNVSINGKPIYKRLLIQHKNQTPTKKEINHEN